jgi:hypothetical protein
VSDVDKSTRSYTEIVGCKFLSALPDKSILKTHQLHRFPGANGGQ